jgi:hypothetical protein
MTWWLRVDVLGSGDEEVRGSISMESLARKERLRWN